VAAPVMLIGLVVWSCLLGAFAATAARPGPELPPLGDRLALLLAALPATAAVLAGGITGVAAHAAGLSTVWALPLGSLVGSGVVGFEGALAVHFLGGVFDRIDPAAAGTG